MGLSSVFGNIGMDKGNNVWSNWSLEDSRKSNMLGCHFGGIIS
jgi:hypothetical protein